MQMCSSAVGISVVVKLAYACILSMRNAYITVFIRTLIRVQRIIGLLLAFRNFGTLISYTVAIEFDFYTHKMLYSAYTWILRTLQRIHSFLVLLEYRGSIDLFNGTVIS